MAEKPRKSYFLLLTSYFLLLTSYFRQAVLVYFSNKNEFTTKFTQLKSAIEPETENYIFKIIPQPDNTRSIMHIAQAKSKNIKSYIGLVY